MKGEPRNPVAWPYSIPNTWIGQGWLEVFDVGPYFWRGDKLPRFYRDGNRVWAERADGGRSPAGVVLETLDDFSGLDELLEGAEGVTLWFSSSTFRRADRIPHADAVGAVVVLEAKDLVDLSPIKVFRRLQSVCLEDARITDLSHLLDLQKLGALFLDGLECLASLEPTVGLANLRHLEMRSGEYPDLRVLARHRLLDSIGLPGYTSDSELASIAKGCKRLRRLACWGAFKLRTLAPLRDLPALEVLEVSGSHVEDFTPLEGLSELKSLDLFNNEKLRALTPLLRMPRLARLELAACTKIKDLAALQHMPQLTSLSLPETVAEEDLHSITMACANLERLEFGTPIGFNKAEEPEINGISIGDLKRLRVLRVWRPLRNADSLRRFEKLDVLDMTLARESRNLSFLKSLESVRELSICLNGEVIGAGAIGQLRELQSLTVTFGGFDLGVLVPLQKLVFLSIGNCTNVANIESLSGLPNLTIVVIGDTKLDRLWRVPATSALSSLTIAKGQLADLGPLVDAKQLRYLNLEGNEHSLDLAPLANLANLWKLDVSDFGSKCDLSPLRNVPRLAHLSATYCPWLTSEDLDLLQGAPKLTTLLLDANERLDDLAPVAKLPTLENLSVNWCSEVADIKPLENLRELRSLGLSGCDGIGDFTPIGRLKRLVNVTLDATQVRDISFVKELPDLRYINLSQCWEIDDISPLAGLRAKGCVVHIAERHEELEELDAKAPRAGK